ncbi:MAG: NTP transferase domain-containing protein [Solirubrobacterales bacterium]
MAPLPAVYLAAGEGLRLRPLTDDRPKAMLELGDVPLARRALESLHRAGVRDVVAVTGHCAAAFSEVGDLLSGECFNPRFAQYGNVYSLWCARDVVRNGCYIVNSDVLFEDEIARRLVVARGSAVLCASDHGVDLESMKAVAVDGRLQQLSKHAPVGPHPEYIGLTRVDPGHGELLAAVLDGFVERRELDVYYEDSLTELAGQVPVNTVAVDGLAWIEIDDHDDLSRARDDVLARVG